MNKLIFALLIACFLPAVAAANVAKLVMPGPLIEGHAKIEKNCDRCHNLFDELRQRDLCLDCHKLVAADIEAMRGFHGKNPQVGRSECRNCHTDHSGRQADILLLDAETFDHQNTDFALEGAHLRVKCDHCHTPELSKAEVRNNPDREEAALRKQRNAPDQCVECHKKIEPHRGLLGNNCQKCHQPHQWSKVSFAHETTKFKLTGAHQKLNCNLCHPQQRWKETPQDCFSCHRLNDSHAGRNGEKCQNCHSPTGAQQTARGEQQSAWKEISFDHGTTKFPLRNKHENVACVRCHTKNIYQQKLATDCLSCHQTDNLHRDRFGDNCETCHQTSGWKQTKFDHDKTKFPLRDKHARLACDKCHTGPSGDKLALDCYSCHQLDDSHRGQQGQDCARCHNPRGWRVDIKFEHDLTRFPLIGMHAVAPCESCHVGTTFKNTPADCISCHQKVDAHQQKLGEDCAFCHNPNGWKLWQFDHNSQTKFRLEGAHETLECLACHQQPSKDKLKLDMTCASCHRKDEPHNGQFGRNCERCHLSTNFKQLRIAQ